MRLALALALLGACSSNEPCKCTLSDLYIAITIETSTGVPVTGLTTKTVRKPDGKDISPPQVFGGIEAGQYLLLSDDVYHDVYDPVTIVFSYEGAAGSGSIEGTGYLDECHCHVQFDGPRLITFR